MNAYFMFLSRAGCSLSRAIRVGASSGRVFWTVVGLTLAYLPSAVATPAECRHTVIASSGNAAPAGGDYLFFNQVAFAAKDEVAFAAFLRGLSNSGVFLGDGATTSVVALGGNPDPAAGNLGFFVSNFFVADHEIIVTAAPFDPAKITSVFGVRKGNASLIVEDGQVAPDGGSLLLGELDASSRGAIGYSASVIGGADTQGLFRTDRTGTTKIAGDNSGLPTGGTVLFFADTSINSRGQIAFFAGMEGGSSDFGVFRGDGRGITTIFAANQNAPGGGTFVDFGRPLLNNRGQVAVVCLINDGIAPSGLLLSDGKTINSVALTGRPAPKGGNYGDRFAVPTLLDDEGRVVFNVNLLGGTSNRGIFRKDHERTTPIALQGSAAPGTTGTFADFVDGKMTEDGTLAILARLTIGVGGVDTTNNMGIWVGTSESNLRLVVRTGELIGEKTLVRLPGPLDLSEKGVAWIGNFSGGTSAVVLTALENRH